MSIKIPDFIIPSGGSTEFLIEDKYVRGGLHTVATYTDLALLNTTTLKVGMLCVTQDDLKVYQLSELNTVGNAKVGIWEIFNAGGGNTGGGLGFRQTVTHLEQNILAGASREFSLPLGKTALVYKLEVDTSCKVEAFDTLARDETNPFLFIATPDHLKDDGSTLMTDGTILRGRRYTILSNQENVGNATTDINIYFRVTNTDVVDKGVSLTISFLPIESI